MSRQFARSYSEYTLTAVSLLGTLIRAARKERGLSEAELSTRAAISRGLLNRIEKGDPRCELGAAFEVATLVGLRLFDADAAVLSRHLRETNDKLTLLPKAVRKKTRVVNDDF